MATLSEDQMDDLQDRINNGDIAGFYELLDQYGEDYGRLGLGVTENNTWQGQIANGFAESGAMDNGVNIDYGSDTWLDLNKKLAQRHLDAYVTNNGGTPTWEQIKQYHNEEFVFAGLDENDWFPNKMLNEASDPAALWEDWMVNKGAGDIWEDAKDILFAGTPVGIDMDSAEFARNFIGGLVKMDKNVLNDLINDANPLSDIAEAISHLPENISESLLDKLSWLWTDPAKGSTETITDTASDDTYTVDPNADGRHTVFEDAGGNDTIIVKKGAGVTITNDGDPSSSDTVILEGYNRDDIALVRNGNNLNIIDKRTGKVIVVLEDHFSPNGPGVTGVDFAPDANGNGGDGEPIYFDSLTGEPVDNTPDDASDNTPVDASMWDWFTDALQTLDGWIIDFLEYWGIADLVISPIVLDLDSDGVELVSLDDTTVYWDIDEDGYAEASGWVAPDDGFLAIDLNGDGMITEHSELFGDSVYADGFAALAVYDSNSDGVIDANDAQFGDLIVWQDANQNGISEADEMHTLADFNITSINLNATSVSQTNAGHDVRLVSTFTMDDGVSGPQTLDMVDVWFQYDNVNSNFIGDYTLDIASLFVTTQRGYGNLPDLHVAASMDNDTSDQNSLMSLLTSLSAKGFSDLFVQDGTVLSDVRDIMFRWAGVDAVDPTSRGGFVDARELGFMEKLTDEIYHDGYDPAGLQGDALSRAFDFALQAISARLIAQAEGAQLFEGDFYYNPATDVFAGITGLSQSGLDTLLAKAQDASQVGDKVAYWGDVVRVVDQIIGVASLSAGDAAALETAIATSDDTLTTQLILDTLEWNSSEGSTILGTTSADTLGGTIGDDTIYGGYGNDIVMGGIGADTLRGQGHDDTLNGQSGDDLLFGETGNDTYLYFAGQGHDSITEQSGSDKVLFGPGVTSADLTFTRISNDALQIDVAHSAGGGAVTIENQFTAAQVEMLEFDDGSTLDLSTVSHTLEGTAGADTLKGIRYGGSQEDTIYGLGGDDMIYGYNAALDYAQNWLYGGDGNDTIYGAYGVDYIEGGADNDYIRGYNGDDELHGGFGDDEILGGNQNDTLYGDAGADILKGDGGNDILTGGLGADELWGGTGYDTFTFLDGESLDAVDTIKDFNTVYDAIDISDLLSAYDPLVDAITDFVQITDNGTDSTLSVDLDGGADNFTAIALIAGKTGLTDEEALETSGTLIAA